MKGEVFRFTLPRWFLLQIVNVAQWSDGYNPPRVDRGRKHLHLRIGNYQFRTWRPTQ